MLTFLGFAMVMTFMYLIMTKRLSALIALIIVPIAFALIGGFAAGIGPMMLEGIGKLAPTGVMLMFAILYFGVMIDAGLFDPLVRVILRFVKGDPMKIVLGTAVLAMLISLDGDGSTTYMITVSAMLPLYQRLGIPTVASIQWTADQVLHRLLPAGTADAEHRDASGRLLVTELVPHSSWWGRRLTDVESTVGMRIAYLTRLGDGQLPRPGDRLQEGDVLHAVYPVDRRDQVEAALQAGVDRLAAERRFPVLG